MKINDGRRLGWCGRFVLFACMGAVPGCSAAVSRLDSTVPACRVATTLEPPVRWIDASDPRSLELSRGWCDPVGPVAAGRAASRAAAGRRGDIFVVSWNVAVGAADVEDLLRTLAEGERRAGRGAPEFVLLLQETYRTGAVVPASYPRRARVPRRIASGARQGRDVVSLAARMGMHFVYVPSMRNGGATGNEPGEDRGNAILSTLPLHDVTAIELPFEHQRRVAVAATVDVNGPPLTVASVHLDTRRPFSQGSVFFGPLARRRQVLALIDALSPARAGGPVVVAGDFNTLAGPGEPAIKAMQQRFTRVSCGSPITHRWNLQLDYMFATSAALFSACDRPADRFDSDHHPLVARLRLNQEP